MALETDRSINSDATEGIEAGDLSKYYGLIGTIEKRFQGNVVARLFHEERWLACYRQVRGLYGPDVAFRKDEKSRVFITLTKTKVQAAYGQILEIMFSDGQFPLSIKPTPMPEGVEQYMHASPANMPPVAQQTFPNAQAGMAKGGKAPPPQPAPPPAPPQPQAPTDLYGFPGDGKDLPPGATAHTLGAGIQPSLEKLGFEPGPAPDNAHNITIAPDQLEAESMQKVIMDQLEEGDAQISLRATIYEMCMLGTGAVKGPFTTTKTVHKFAKEDDKIVYKPIQKFIPSVEHVSIWDLYPDADATNYSDIDHIIQRHCLTATQLRALRDRPFFDKDAIRRVLEKGPNWVRQWWELQLDDSQYTVAPQRYEVKEYWGVMDLNLLRTSGIDIKGLEDLDDLLEEVQINAWICGQELLRVVLNPFTPSRIPYHICPYEINPYNFWGTGVAENMADSQQIINGFARLAIDNASLAGNLVFEIQEDRLVPGQDYEMYPGKTFRTQGTGQPGQSIFGFKFPNVFLDNFQVIDRFRQLADESTGLPSYSHGQTGVTSTTRTASGLSMLMGAAALNIKTVVKNIDDFIIEPLGTALFFWNMQYNTDVPEIRGDLEIIARGTSALVAKEVKSQRLMSFLQIVMNPALAPFVKLPEIVKEIAKLMDLDTHLIINDPDTAALYSKIIGQAGGLGNSGGGQGSPPAMQSPTGTQGAAGNIAPQAPANPGQPGFSGSSSGGGTMADSANAGR